MEIKSVEAYLTGHQVVEIKIGKSEADVYEIDNQYILKHIRREKLVEEGLFDTYMREAYFYQSTDKNRKDYLPERLEVHITENEVIMLMKKYDGIDRNAINEKLLQKIMKALAKVHTDKIPPFLPQDREKAEPLSTEKIRECVSGWKTVLEEHPGVFDENKLVKLAEKINEIIIWHASEECVLSHGDFHWDNLLMDENGDILICDWQGVGPGGAAGDLSFFLSRLRADGIQIDEDKVLDYYAEAVYRFSGRRIEQREIFGHMKAANIITSFLFWHQYLHGSSEERVGEIYNAMTILD